MQMHALRLPPTDAPCHSHLLSHTGDGGEAAGPRSPGKAPFSCCACTLLCSRLLPTSLSPVPAVPLGQRDAASSCGEGEQGCSLHGSCTGPLLVMHLLCPCLPRAQGYGHPKAQACIRFAHTLMFPVPPASPHTHTHQALGLYSCVSLLKHMYPSSHTCSNCPCLPTDTALSQTLLGEG